MPEKKTASLAHQATLPEKKTASLVKEAKKNIAAPAIPRPYEGRGRGGVSKNPEQSISFYSVVSKNPQ